MANKLTDRQYESILRLLREDGITYSELTAGAVTWIVLTAGSEGLQDAWSSLSQDEQRLVTSDLKDNLHSTMAAAGETGQSQWDYE